MRLFYRVEVLPDVCFRESFHEALVADFFGKSKRQMTAEKLQFIGWGFSYQAKHRTTNAQVCDFVFTSSTFNRGNMFNIDGVKHMQDRDLQEKMRSFLRFNFNYMRAFNIRTLKNLNPIIEYTRRWDMREKIPSCP